MQQDFGQGQEPTGLLFLLGVEGAHHVLLALWVLALQPAVFSLLLVHGSKNSDVCNLIWM